MTHTSSDTLVAPRRFLPIRAGRRTISASTFALASALASALALALACPAPARAQAATSPPEATVARPEQDLGTVGVGTDPTVAFSIRNRGGRPLTLQVGPLPKGLKLAHADAEIAPAATGVVRLQLDTFAANALEWRVKVTTNDPFRQALELVVRADVRAFLSLTPPSARFTFVQFGKEGGTAHLLAAEDGAPMRLLGVDSPFDYIKATVRELPKAERDADTPGRQWRIALTISGNAPVGPIAGYIVARTTHPKQPKAYLPVSGFVRPLFAVTPNAVQLNDVRTSATGDRPLQTLVVKNFGEAPIAVTRVSSDLAGLDANLVEVEVGHTWRVELRMDARAAAAGPFTGTLRLATSSAHVPELTVPIQGTRLHDAQP